MGRDRRPSATGCRVSGDARPYLGHDGRRAEALAIEANRQARERHVRLLAAWASVKRPVTLRDVRRAISLHDRRGRWRTSPASLAIIMLAEAALAYAAGQYDLGGWQYMRPNLVDRLISKHGPDYRLDEMIAGALSEEALAKVTAAIMDRGSLNYITDLNDRVADVPLPERAEAERTDHRVGEDAPISDGPHTNPDADTHGGDGNSGEVDHAAQTRADDRSSDSACDAGAIGDTPDGQPDSRGAGTDCSTVCASGDDAGSRTEADGSETREGSGMPTGQGDCGPDEGTGEMGAHRRAEHGARDESAAGTRAPAEACAADGATESDAQPPSGHGEAGSPEPRHSAGGHYLAVDIYDPTRLERIAARRVTDLFSRIVEQEAGIRGAPSPRIDARALARELVSQRMAIHRARRLEREPREMVIAVDDSGSCSGVVRALYATAVAIARSVPTNKVSVLIHSNGYSLRAGEIVQPWLARELARRKRELDRHYFATTQRTASEEIWRVIANRRPSIVLALGDHDADWALDVLAANRVRVIALHHNVPSKPDDACVKRIGPCADIISAELALRAHVRRAKR